MIRLLKILVALVVLWSAWWLFAGYGTRAAVSGWFDEQRARGWQAEYADIATRGYPIRHQTRLTHPVLADPATGVAWRADWLTLESPAAQPGKQALRFPETAQRISYFDQTFELVASDMRAGLHVNPAAAFELSDLAFQSGAWAIADGSGPLMTGDSAELSMTQHSEARDTYDIRGDVPRLTLAQNARGAVQASTLPDQIETLTLKMTVQFARPWDMSAITENRPQPRMITLDLAELRWGKLQLLSAGRLEIDGGGVPTGTLTVKAENWREMLAIATQTGALPAELAGAAENTLKALSRLGGNPNALDVKLTFKKGRVYSGILPLGPSPRIILR